MAVAPSDAAAAPSSQADAHLREAAFLRSFVKSYTNIKSDSARDELEGHLVSYLARFGVQVSRKESSTSLAQKLHRRYLDLERQQPDALSAAAPITAATTASTTLPMRSSLSIRTSLTPSQSLAKRAAAEGLNPAPTIPAKKAKGAGTKAMLK